MYLILSSFLLLYLMHNNFSSYDMGDSKYVLTNSYS